MKISLQQKLFTVVLTGCVLSSCVYRSTPVPEMPYTPRQQPVVQPVVQQPAMQPVPNQPGVWAPVTQMPTAPALHPMPQQPTVYTPAVQPVAPQQPVAPVARPTLPQPATPAPATSSHITQTYTPPALTPQPAAVQPAPVTTVTPPATTGQATTPTDPKLITNTGPIPVAMRVEGDPIRVYNPLDPTKTIRIIDPKTGKVHPSGKVLKVKGTNFKFIVP
ncbi:MAG: hypothetical protein IKZ13_03990 [Akkermansia sp.]|nr:hypothetical protein [Akkermansia sp.]